MRVFVLPTRFAVVICAFFCFFHSVHAADTNFAKRPDVQTFIAKMVREHDFKTQPLMTLFSQVQVRPQVLHHMKKPLEKETWYTYQRAFINEWRIKHGVKFWNKYEKVLQQAEQEFSIPASVIVATIGIETKYGERTGDYRVMDSLSSLGFSNSPRAGFFRKELEQFLLLTREQKLDPLSIMGSYAGAIGQPQFMPSSYRYYAVNFSKSGKTDLMHNEIDVIGSIANYYSKHGWKWNAPVAMRALIVGDRYNYLSRTNKIDQPLTTSRLMRYGIVPKRKLPQENQKVKIIELQNRYNKEYWLGFHNFNVIKRYNSSDLYAMAVYQLSNYITALRDRENNA